MTFRNSDHPVSCSATYAQSRLAYWYMYNYVWILNRFLQHVAACVCICVWFTSYLSVVGFWLHRIILLLFVFLFAVTIRPTSIENCTLLYRYLYIWILTHIDIHVERHVHRDRICVCTSCYWFYRPNIDGTQILRWYTVIYIHTQPYNRHYSPILLWRTYSVCMRMCVYGVPIHKK